MTCLSVVGLRLEEASALLGQEFLTQAAVVFSLAVEEFGKAAMLHTARGQESDPVTVEDFYDHQAKLDAAAQHIAQEHLWLAPDLEGNVFDPPHLASGRPADVAARLAGLYVDWRVGKWQYGVKVNGSALAASIDGVQTALAHAMVDWT